METEEKGTKEEPKKLCDICGKPRTRGHHHGRSKEKEIIPHELFAVLRRAILLDFLEDMRGQL